MAHEINNKYVNGSFFVITPTALTCQIHNKLEKSLQYAR